MNMSGFLPQRWHTPDRTGRLNEAFAGVLDTAAIRPTRRGLVLFATVGSTQVPAFLVSVKSAWHHLRRGRVVVFDDGTLEAQDRTVLAQHCGDPEIVRLHDIASEGFPDGIAWLELLAVLDRRVSDYWLRIGPDTVSLGPLGEIERALGINRSLAMVRRDGVSERPLAVGDFARPAFRPREDARNETAIIERHLPQMGEIYGWRYLPACSSLAGFAAGNAGRSLAQAFHARLVGLVGRKLAASSAAAHITSSFVIANETQPVCLPRHLYCDHGDPARVENAALVRFDPDNEASDDAWQQAGARAIAALPD